MKGDLINGAYYVLGELKGASRVGLWLAHSLVTGELVTLAVPSPDGLSPTADELKQEGEIFGEISSRHVQAVVDWSSEDVLVAWEYVPAWTLATALRAAPPPSVAVVLRLMLDLAEGMAAVHGRGAIYRGLHPGLVLILRDGTARLATTPEAVLAKRGRLVETGPPRETPIRYLAPEQIEGTISVCSDLYTLAAVAYELLTGRQLYGHSDPVTLAVEILETTPPPPSTHRPDVPAEVDDLFSYCLARKPEDRPPNVAALVTHLQKLSINVVGQEAEPLAQRLGLHPVAYPLLASDSDRVELSQAVSAPLSYGLDGGDERADAARRHHEAQESALVEDDEDAARAPVPTDGQELARHPEGAEPGPAEQESAVETSSTSVDGECDHAAEAVAGSESLHKQAAEEPDQVLGQRASQAPGHVGDQPAYADIAKSPEDDLDLRYGGSVTATLSAADGTTFHVHPPAVTIGRRGANGSRPDIDLRELDHGMVVSREHAAVRFEDGGWFVEELKARNGTWLNGERLVPGEPLALSAGDQLRFANLELVFQCSTEPTDAFGVTPSPGLAHGRSQEGAAAMP